MKLGPLTFNAPLIDRGGLPMPDFQRWLAKIPPLFEPRQAPTYALFDHFATVGNVGTGEDDLYSDTVAKGQLANDGDKITAEYSGILVFHATATRTIRAYFGGTKIFDSGALTIAASNTAWGLNLQVIRESATVVRCFVALLTRAANLPDPAYTRITGLTLTNAQILKITGEAAAAGAATDDITARLGMVHYQGAA